MKKNLFFLAAGALALTACTSEEVVDVSQTQGNAIAFKNVINKSTRAVEGDLSNELDNFDDFRVFGYYTQPNSTTPFEIFNNVEVKRPAGSKKWEYDNVRYWIPGNDYTFYAYSCGDTELDSKNGKGTALFSLAGTPTLSLNEYRCDKEHQHDLVSATFGPTTAAPNGNQDVTLTFKHALCKVKASFITDLPSDYQVFISDVYITSFFNLADYNVVTGEWNDFKFIDNDANSTVNLSLATTDSKNFVDNSVDENGKKNTLVTGEAFIIPKLYDSNKNEYAQLHFTVTIMRGTTEILKRSIYGTWSPKWNKGTIYNYSVNITGSNVGIEPIVFSTSQSLDNSSWGDTEQVNMTFGLETNEKEENGGNNN